MATNYNLNEEDLVQPIYTDYITKNPSWSNPEISIDTICWHDVAVGTITKKAADWQARWNRKESSNSVHAIVAWDKTCIMMPCFEKKGKAKKVWGCGSGKLGSYNDSAIQFEQVCPSAVKYSGAGFVILDKKLAIEQQLAIFEKSIDFCARICLYHSLNPLGKNKYGQPVITCHQEAFLNFRASNHADVLEIFRLLPELGYNMDVLRQKVKDRMEEIEMTDAKFAEYMDRYLANLAKKPTTQSWQKTALDYCKDNKLMSGVDAKGNMAPASLLTRAELAQVAMNLDKEIKAKK